MRLFLINLIPVFSFLLSLTVFHQKTKKEMLNKSIICNSLSFFNFILLGGLSGSIVKAIAIVRDSYILFSSKPKIKFLILLLLIYILTSFISYNGIFSLFSIIPAFIYSCFLWQNDPQKIRVISILTYQFWLIYNLSVMSYTGAFLNIVSSISVFLALKKNKKNFL